MAQMSMRRGQQKKMDIEKQVVWKPSFCLVKLGGKKLLLQELRLGKCALYNLKEMRLEDELDISVFPKIVVFPPKWMVKIMENPMNKWMIWGYIPLFFGNIHILKMKFVFFSGSSIAKGISFRSRPDL